MPVFSLQIFLRQIPLNLINAYLKTRGLKPTCFSKSDCIELITKHLGKRGHIVQNDFFWINRLATKRGRARFDAQIKSPMCSCSLPDELINLTNNHVRAMRIFLKYPDLFRWTAEMLYIDGIEKAKWREYKVTKNVNTENAEDVCDQIETVLDRIYFRKKKPYHGAYVDYYYCAKPDRHLFIVYLAGGAKIPPMTRSIGGVFKYFPKKGILKIYFQDEYIKVGLKKIFCDIALGMPSDLRQI